MEMPSPPPRNVAIIRLKTHGHRFEVVCWKQRLLQYVEAGRSQPPSNQAQLLFDRNVYANAHRGQKITQAELIEAFGTNDSDVVASNVLQFGEIVVDEEDRKAQRKKDANSCHAVLSIVDSLLLGRWTGVPPTKSEVCGLIEKKMASTLPSLLDPTEAAIWIASEVCRKSAGDLVRYAKKVVVAVPTGNVGIMLRSLATFPFKTFTLVLAADTAAKKDSPFREVVLLIDGHVVGLPISPWATLLSQTDSQIISAEEVPPSALTEFSMLPVDLNELSRVVKVDTRDIDERMLGAKEQRQVNAAPAHQASEGISSYEKMKHYQLQELCRMKGLAHGGKKTDLIERLEASDELPQPKK